jgi:hypothetical protein
VAAKKSRPNKYSLKKLAQVSHLGFGCRRQAWNGRHSGWKEDAYEAKIVLLLLFSAGFLDSDFLIQRDETLCRVRLCFNAI